MTDAGYQLAWESEAIERVTALAESYPAEIGQGVVPAIYELATNPRPAGSTQLGGSGTYRRLLLGYFRVLYAVDDEARLVRIILVGRADQAR